MICGALLIVLILTVAAVFRLQFQFAELRRDVAKSQEAKSSLSEAVSDLNRVLGDMNVMSGLIATNERELEVLKALGDLNYTETTPSSVW